MSEGEEPSSCNTKRLGHRFPEASFLTVDSYFSRWVIDYSCFLVYEDVGYMHTPR